jgi:hypothetical protein
VNHVHNLSLTSGEGLKDIAEILGRNVDVKGLERLEDRSVLRALEDDLGT